MAKFKLELATVLDSLDRMGEKSSARDIRMNLSFDVGDKIGRKLYECCELGYMKKIKVNRTNNLYAMLAAGKKYLAENHDRIQEASPPTAEEKFEESMPTRIQDTVNGISELVVVHQSYVKSLRRTIKQAQKELLSLGETV